MEAKLNKISELSTLLNNKNELDRTFTSVYKQFRVSNLLSHLKIDKSQGIGFSTLLMYLCIFRICNATVHHFWSKQYYSLLDSGKNCFYRLLSNERINWRGILLCICKRFHKIVEQRSADVSTSTIPRFYIIDDTTIEKTGRRIERIGRVFDHTTHNYVLGFKALVLSIFDGINTIACDFSFHDEKGKKGNCGMKPNELKERFSKSRQDSSYGKVREYELDAKKTDNALQMLKRAWKSKIRASYVLMDSWFFSTSLIQEIRKIGKGCIHVICMAKHSTKRYKVGERMLNSKEIIAKHERKKSQSCRKYKCRYFKVKTKLDDVDAVLYFVKYKNNKHWNILVSTDCKLSFLKVFEYYKIRWTTEVMFKECKQYLGLGKCQCQDFDSQIADATLAFMTYTMLSLRKRFSDYETIGGIFQETKEELLALTLWRRILPIVEKLLHALAVITDRPIEEMMNLLLGSTAVQKEMIYFAHAINNIAFDN